MQNITYLLADGGAAWFAGREDSMSLLAQVFDEIGDVGCFARAFGAF
jgi:hypothetical protein